MAPPQRYLVGSKTEAIIIDEDGVNGAFALLKKSKEEEIASYDGCWHTEWNCCISDPHEISVQFCEPHSTGVRRITHFDRDEVVMTITVRTL